MTFSPRERLCRGVERGWPAKSGLPSTGMLPWQSPARSAGLLTCNMGRLPSSHTQAGGAVMKATKQDEKAGHAKAGRSRGVVGCGGMGRREAGGPGDWNLGFPGPAICWRSRIHVGVFVWLWTGGAGTEQRCSPSPGRPHPKKSLQNQMGV